MKNYLKIPFALFVFISGILVINACKKDKVQTNLDADLLAMAKDKLGFKWFQNKDSLLSKSPGTGHSAYPFVKTRYNSTASTKLDANGKIIAGSVFPEGSVIVKELFSDSTKIGRYAVLYKNSGHESADAKGWVWGYINSDGTVAAEASKKGASCINCHSQGDNIDYMLMNKYFP